MNLDLNPTPSPPHREVVRVRTCAYETKRGLSVRRDVTVLRKLSSPNACLLREDMSAVGADETAERIINLHKVEDGLYLLEVCNEHTDWETGQIDDYDLQLVPYAPTPTETSVPPSGSSPLRPPAQ